MNEYFTETTRIVEYYIMYRQIKLLIPNGNRVCKLWKVGTALDSVDK